jgi:hypothetical protein
MVLMKEKYTKEKDMEMENLNFPTRISMRDNGEMIICKIFKIQNKILITKKIKLFLLKDLKLNFNFSIQN